MKKHSLIFIIFVCVFFSSFCNQDKTEWKGTIEEIDGVTIVKNPINPIYKEDVFTLEVELSIGEREAQEEYMFSQLNSIDIDEDENIYVFDTKQAKIKVFNKDGNFLQDIGRSGQGPGEFMFPWGIIISPGQEIVVCDLMYRRLIFFSLDGKYQREVPTWRQGRLLNMMLDSRGNIVGEAYQKKIFALKKFNSNFEPFLTLKSIRRDKIPILESLSPKLQWSISNSDEIIWGYSAIYEFNVHNSDGKLMKKIIKDYEPTQIMEEDYSEQVRTKFGGRPIPPEFERELPKNYPAFKSFSIDDEGRLFVITFEKADKGGGNYCDVFDSDGKYIAKIPFRSAPRVWKNGKFYTIESDEEGFQVVKKYKVTWN